MHILLIEDDPFIARAVSAALESEAHVVTYAPTGPEGLAALRVHDVDAVLNGQIDVFQHDYLLYRHERQR